MTYIWTKTSEWRALEHLFAEEQLQWLSQQAHITGTGIAHYLREMVEQQMRENPLEAHPITHEEESR